MITGIVLHNRFTGGEQVYVLDIRKPLAPSPDSRFKGLSRWSPSNQIKETGMIKTEYKKGSRPTKGVAEKKKYRITVKLNTQDYYTFKGKAKSAGITMSEFVRKVLDKGNVIERLTVEQADFIRKLCGMANNLNQLAHRANADGFHVAFNRIDNNGKTISDRNDRFRSEKICKELTTKYGLYFAGGKENIKEHRSKEPDKTKYEIYQALKAEITRYRDWKTLLSHLKTQDIDVRFKYKGNSQEVQGIIFEKNGYHFNGSKVDRNFSYSKIDFALQQNNREYEQQIQGMINLISNVASVTSEITNNLIEGGLGLFQTHGTVPAEVYNTLDKKKKKKKRKIHL